MDSAGSPLGPFRLTFGSTYWWQTLSANLLCQVPLPFAPRFENGLLLDSVSLQGLFLPVVVKVVEFHRRFLQRRYQKRVDALVLIFLI